VETRTSREDQRKRDEEQRKRDEEAREEQRKRDEEQRKRDEEAREERKNQLLKTDIIINKMPVQNAILDVPSISASASDQESTRIYEEAVSSLGIVRLVEPPQMQESLLQPLTFDWTRQQEKDSYVHVVEWCRVNLPEKKAYDVSVGQKCSQGNLYHITLCSFRQELGQHGIEAHVKPVVRLKGRPDIVITLKPPDGHDILFHNRVYVLVAIEVKKSLTDSEYSSSYREAEKHLLGLCAYNSFSSPLVLLSDLNAVHSVLYLTSTSRPLKFTVASRQFKCFHLAMKFCLEMHPERANDCLRDFGRAVSPLHEDSVVS